MCVYVCVWGGEGGRRRGRKEEGGGEKQRGYNILATEPNIGSRTPVVHVYSSLHSWNTAQTPFVGRN